MNRSVSSSRDSPAARPAAEAGAPPALARGERFVILGALAGVTLLGWLYLAALARPMDGMAPMAGAMGAMPKPWRLADAALMFAMWWVMMVGMMLPSAAPMILMFGRINANRRASAKPYVPVFVFTGGYVLAWGGYSAFATAAQWALERAALMAPMTAITAPLLGAGVWIGAGVFQFTPLKQACLRHCRSPLALVLNHWRDGAWGALRMGAGHGTYCLGCCAGLMALLFVGGVMNLLWAAALAGFVLVEKRFPAGPLVARVGGGAMIAFGLFLLLPG